MCTHKMDDPTRSLPCLAGGLFSVIYISSTIQATSHPQYTVGYIPFTIQATSHPHQVHIILSTLASSSKLQYTSHPHNFHHIHNINYISSTIYVDYISSTIQATSHPHYVRIILTSLASASKLQTSHPHSFHHIRNICGLHLIYNIGYISSTLEQYIHLIHTYTVGCISQV